MIKLYITLLLFGAILVSQAYVEEEFATFRSTFNKKYDETEEVSRINKHFKRQDKYLNLIW